MTPRLEGQYNTVPYVVHLLQAMVGLACDLMLDSMECCTDASKWAWFHQYCMAARMAKALQRRIPLPQEYVHD